METKINQMDKRRLFIIGAGGFGRELEVYLDSVDATNRDWNLVGFIDDNINAIDLFPSDYKVVGSVNDFPFRESDYVVLAIANSEIKHKIYMLLQDKVTFFTYIDKTAIVGKFVNIGEGSIICPNCIITSNVKLGLCSILNIGTQIGHDTQIGDFCSFMPNVDIGGETSIANDVYMGTNSTVINMKNICSNVTIGAGAIVVKNINNEGVYVGNPAVKIK